MQIIQIVLQNLAAQKGVVKKEQKKHVQQVVKKTVVKKKQKHVEQVVKKTAVRKSNSIKNIRSL